MTRRSILKYAFAGIAAIILTLVVGWWQVDGPGAPEQAGLRPVALSEMEFRLTDHEGNEVGPENLIGSPSMVHLLPGRLSDDSVGYFRLA